MLDALTRLAAARAGLLIAELGYHATWIRKQALLCALVAIITVLTAAVGMTLLVLLIPPAHRIMVLSVCFGSLLLVSAGLFLTAQHRFRRRETFLPLTRSAIASDINHLISP